MKVGFDIDNYDFTEYASALDGEICLVPNFHRLKR